MRSLIFIFMILFTSACKKNKSLNTPFNAQDCAGSVGIAWTIAIGHNQKPLQKCIEVMEKKAYRKQAFSKDERDFLRRFYGTLSVGGQMSIFAARTGRLINHYLKGSGETYKLNPQIFRQSKTVQINIDRLKKKVRQNGCKQEKTFSKSDFQMSRQAFFYSAKDILRADSILGLYRGDLKVTAVPMKNGACKLQWRADMPWKWPTFDELYAKHGCYTCRERFPLPNLKSLITKNKKQVFRVSNGLGGELERAKGIYVEEDQARKAVSVRVEINVAYGISIPEKASEIQEKLANIAFDTAENEPSRSSISHADRFRSGNAVKSVSTLLDTRSLLERP